MVLNLRLNAQVQALRAENARLADSNAQTRTELKTAASGSALEESARQQGYYRSGEQVYVIVQPTPSASAAVAKGSGGAAGGVGAGSAAGAGGAAGTVGPAAGPAASRATGSRTNASGGETVWAAIIKWWRQVWH